MRAGTGDMRAGAGDMRAGAGDMRAGGGDMRAGTGISPVGSGGGRRAVSGALPVSVVWVLGRFMTGSGWRRA